jgi:hypothetical protein
MAYLSTQTHPRRRLSLSRLMADADTLLGHAAVVLSLLFIATLIVAL